MLRDSLSVVEVDWLPDDAAAFLEFEIVDGGFHPSSPSLSALVRTRVTPIIAGATSTERESFGGSSATD